jgi:drug/metabolite transporter (DMT)-like permease
MTPSTAPSTMSARDWAMLLTLGALWGGSFFFARVAVMEVHPLTLVLFRVGIAALALQIYLRVASIPLAPARPYLGAFLILGLVNNVIPFSLMFTGQTQIGAGLASVINATTPFWTMILANAVTADEKFTPRKLAGIALGIAGTAVMVGPGLIAGLGGPAWAKLVFLGMSLSYAAAFIYARRFRALAPQLVATGQLTAATIIMIPVVMIVNGPQGLFEASPAAWAAILALALASTAFAYIIYFALIRSAGSTNASLVTLLVPISAILLGTLILSERLAIFEIAGMVLIAIGLLTIDGRLRLRR